MKKLLLLLLPLLLFAQTPFILTGIKKVYPMVEINTKKLDPSLKPKIQAKLLAMTKKLQIDTTGYSQRPLVIQITSSNIKGTEFFKTALIMGEEMKRLDDDEEVFAITYQMSDTIEIEDFDEEIFESVDFLLDQFKEQYREDNQ